MAASARWFRAMPAPVLGLALAGLVAVMRQPLPAGEPNKYEVKPSLEDLRRPMAQVAVRIKDWLDKNEKNGIVIGPFENLPDFVTNPGPGLVKMLADEMKKAKVPVKEKADIGSVGIVGKVYRYPRDLNDRFKKLGIGLEIVDERNSIVFQQEVTSESPEVLEIFDPPRPDVVAGKPEFVWKNYAVEILVNGVPQPATIVNRLPCVSLNVADAFTIRLINKNEPRKFDGQMYEAAAHVTMDGLSIFAFNQELKDGKWRDYHVIVPGKGADARKDGVMDVMGWYVHSRLGGSRKFLVTEHPESAAFLKVLSVGISTVTVQFRRSEPPHREFVFRGVAVSPFWEPLDRNFGELQATIAIRIAGSTAKKK